MKQVFNYKCLRNFGKEKARMDFAFFAIAFNIRILSNKIAQIVKNGGKTHLFDPFPHLFSLLKTDIPISRKNHLKWEA